MGCNVFLSECHVPAIRTGRLAWEVILSGSGSFLSGQKSCGLRGEDEEVGEAVSLNINPLHLVLSWKMFMQLVPRLRFKERFGEDVRRTWYRRAGTYVRNYVSGLE